MAIIDKLIDNKKPDPSLATRVLRELYRHRLIITVPPLLFYFIYLDYNHTKNWKNQKAIKS
jgi:hypothetical protein